MDNKKDNKEIRKEFKDAIKDLGGDFKVAVKDKKRWLVCLIELSIVALIIIADMLTKKYIYGYCVSVSDIIIIKDVLRFTAVQNTGASFGIFKNKTTLLTIVSTICATVLVIFIFFTYSRRNKLLRISLIMITGGAIGNIIDRIELGYVRDYVYFELIDFAVFNVADSFLTIGTILLVFYVLFYFGKEEEAIRKAKAALINKQETEVDTITGNAEAVDTKVTETAEKKEEQSPDKAD